MGKSSPVTRSGHPNASYLLGLTSLRETACPAQSSDLRNGVEQSLACAMSPPWSQANHGGKFLNLLDGDLSKRRTSLLGSSLAAFLLRVIFAHIPSDLEPNANLNARSHGTFSRVVPASEQLALSLHIVSSLLRLHRGSTSIAKRSCLQQKSSLKTVTHSNVPH